MLKSRRISVPVNKYKPPKPAIKLKPKTKPKKVIKLSQPKENETDKIIDPKEYKNKDDPNNLIGLNIFIFLMMQSIKNMKD